MLPVDFHGFDNIRLPDLDGNAECNRRDIAGDRCGKQLPLLPGNLAVGRMLLSVHKFRIASERHAENLSTQILQRPGQPGFILILPWSQVIGHDRFPPDRKSHRRNLSPFLRNEKFNVFRANQPAVRIMRIGFRDKILSHKKTPLL